MTVSTEGCLRSSPLGSAASTVHDICRPSAEASCIYPGDQFQSSLANGTAGRAHLHDDSGQDKKIMSEYTRVVGGLGIPGSYLGEHFKQLVRGPLQGTGGKEEGSQAATWFRREPERAAPDVM